MAKTSKSSKSSTKTTRKKAKPVPAQRYLTYQLTTEGAGSEKSFYIDLARDLSAVNRRLMRQGRVYHIKSVSFISRNTTNNGNYVTISTVPDTWMSRNAWKRGFQAHQAMEKDLADTTGLRGKFADFKVQMDAYIVSNPANYLSPQDNCANPVLPGEWVYSKYVAPTASAGVVDEYTSHLVGNHVGTAPNYTSIGLVRSYGDARATVTTTPAVQADASEDPLMNLVDYGDTVNARIDNLEGDNNSPPYDRDNYPGDNVNMSCPTNVKMGALSDGKLTFGGFSALCGLIEIEAASSTVNDTITMLIELKEGSYRGIAADVI